MDILTALPLELCIRVLKHLTPVATIRLRLVSKSYCDLLTSEEICSSLSHQFITPEYNSAKALSSWRLHYENHVSRRHSFASGKPWKVEILGHIDETELKVFCPETLCLAVTSDAGHSVSVRDLNSVPMKCVFPPTRTPDRSRIEFAALLPSFVVVATRVGGGYAWNLETHKEHRFKLPNSSINGMHGSGNLVAISLEGSVIIHDVQAQKTASFKDTRSDIHVWKGEEIRVHSQRECIISNPEKQVVWMMRRASTLDYWLLVIDGLHLETGGIAQRDIREFPPYYTKFCSGDGLWLFLDQHEPCRRPPGRDNAQKLTRLVSLNQATGKPTVKYLLVEYPPSCAVPAFYQWGPVVASGGLGCFIAGPTGHPWMLNQELRGDVAQARPLDLLLHDWPTSCIWSCDKFALFDTSFELAVARFKGIHDNHDW